MSRPVFTLRLSCCLAFLLSIISHPLEAQQSAPSVELPIDAIHAIAADVDEGRNPLYCYHGRIDGPPLLVSIDSVSVVGSQHDCAGFGIAFVMRTSDRELLAAALRGVIDHNPGLTVVSAFYRTEDVERHGSPVHVPRALTVVRARMATVGSGGS
jgi:hypothetical protein